MKRAIAFLTAAALTMGVGLSGLAFSPSAIRPVVKPSLPKAPSMEDYDAISKVREQNPVDEAFLSAVGGFSYAFAAESLPGQEDNALYSPLSLYMALSLTATGAKGQTQRELFETLGVKGKTASYLSKQNGNLFRLLYTDNEAGKLKIANSIWMRKDVDFQKRFVNNAAKEFYASAYNVDFAKPSAGKAMGKWVADNTGGLIAPEFAADPSRLLTILNTVYFKDGWSDPFPKSATAPAAFYPASGDAVQADFMRQARERGTYWKGEGYTRASLTLNNGGRMAFVLPDKGLSPADLLSTPEKAAALFKEGEAKQAKLTYLVPKFSFDTSTQLKELLQAMGVKQAFTGGADLSGMITGEDAYVSEVKQESHIGIDEEGVEAAAYTMVGICETSALIEELPAYEFRLDRPFLLAIESRQGVPLFIGVVQNPAA